MSSDAVVTGSYPPSDLEVLCAPLGCAIHEILEERSPLNGLPTEEKAYFYEVLKSLTRSKVYVPLTFNQTAESGIFRKKPKGDKLLSQQDIVEHVWKIIREELCKFIEDRISLLLEQAIHEESFEGYVANLWPTVFEEDIKKKMETLNIACQYLNDNFPYIFSQHPMVTSVYRYSEYHCIRFLVKCLGQKIKPFLENVLQNLRNCFNNLYGEHECNGQRCLPGSIISPLKLMNDYKVTLDKRGEASIKDFYMNNVEVTSHHLLRNIPAYQCFNVIERFLTTELVLVSTISRNWSFEVKKIVLKNTLHESTILKKLVPVLVLKENMSKEYEITKLSYLSAGRKEVFFQILTETVTSIFKESYSLQHNMTDILSCCQAMYNHKGPESSLIVKKALRNTFNGEANLIDPLLKDLDARVKKCYQSLILHHTMEPVQAKDNEMKWDVTWRILGDYGLKETFLAVYLEKSLFRRMILMSDNFLNLMNNPQNAEMLLITRLLANSENMESLKKLKSLVEDAEKSHQLLEHYKNKNDIVLVPMLFERNNIPRSFQEMDFQGLNLPPVLQEVWNDFAEEYRKSDSKAAYKSIKLQHMLHHLEVSTPFKLGANQNLILEVTLLQSSILDLFNQDVTFSFEEMLATLNVPSSHLRLALSAFMDIKLLIESAGIYTLNMRFRPDRKKVRNGKLRVTHRSPQNTSTGGLGTSNPSKGNESMWRKELMLACIIRRLKVEQNGYTFNELFDLVNEEIMGFSVGEFKTALSDCSDYYVLDNGIYHYRP
ncbi:LAFE_0F08812g1_1 [Lachancea fermentati]|uniref:LAFE_0F08812g1_1 n=1 Tax=Lachancea fermentati TaxID=4955 RepID=A0A1G4MF43_LACFM|nr:LAFE_0F08812g1_1 [Lachancea fermentati]